LSEAIEEDIDFVKGELLVEEEEEAVIGQGLASSTGNSSSVKSI